eukprot:XP_001707584.1 Hypothetical protein GL50803_19614 [Giardia lamblia ATCC 50803]
MKSKRCCRILQESYSCIFLSLGSAGRVSLKLHKLLHLRVLEAHVVKHVSAAHFLVQNLRLPGTFIFLEAGIVLSRACFFLPNGLRFDAADNNIDKDEDENKDW